MLLDKISRPLCFHLIRSDLDAQSTGVHVCLHGDIGLCAQVQTYGKGYFRILWGVCRLGSSYAWRLSCESTPVREERFSDLLCGPTRLRQDSSLERVLRRELSSLAWPETTASNCCCQLGGNILFSQYPKRRGRSHGYRHKRLPVS